MKPILSFTINEVPKICRVCLNKQTIVNILDTQYKNISMREIFLTIFHDKINEDDKGPVSLCGECLELLLNSYDLLIKYENSQTILKHLKRLLVSSNPSTYVDKIEIDEEPLEKSEIDDENAESCIEAATPPPENDEDKECVVDSPSVPSPENDIETENVVEASSPPSPVKKDYQNYNCGLCDFDGRTKSLNRPKLALQRHYLRQHLLEIKVSSFFCLKCNDRFATLAEILQHTSNNKHQNKQCPICSKKLKSLKLYYRHVKKDLCKDKPYFCRLCHVNLPTFNDVLDHFKMNNHKFDNVCMLCNKAKEKMFLHIMTHRPRRMLYACVICLLPFANEEDYKKHRLQTDHTMKQCWLCEQFIHRKNFSLHLLNHKEEQKFACEVCGIVFTNRWNLNRHLKTTHEGMRFYCDKCATTYTTTTMLNRHIAQVHGKNSDRNANAIRRKGGRPKGQQNRIVNAIERKSRPKGQNKSPMTTICQFCGKTLIKTQKRQITLHDAYHKFDHKVICRVDDCMLTFSDANELKLHMESDHAKFYCGPCQRNYYNKLQFESHMHLHTWKNNYKYESLPPDQQIVCRICDMQFPDYELLTTHLKQNYGLLMCTRDGNSCLKVFANKCVFYKHTIRHDEKPKETTEKPQSVSYSAKERPFSCNICLKRFRTSQQFIRHSRVHTGERPFKCRYCEKSFSHETTRKGHERTHTGEKPYSCSHCHRRFSDSGYARIHESKCQINQHVDKKS